MLKTLGRLPKNSGHYRVLRRKIERCGYSFDEPVVKATPITAPKAAEKPVEKLEVEEAPKKRGRRRKAVEDDLD